MNEGREEGLIRQSIPQAWGAGLVPLCQVEPHSHGGTPCKTPGKRPVERAFTRLAAERWREPERTAEARLGAAEAWVRDGRNVGLVPPPGVLILDADTLAAVEWLDEALPGGTPVQRRTPEKAHYYVRVAAELARALKAKQLAWSDADGREIRVDLRCAGKSQAVVPPSRHTSGQHYRWETPLPETIEEVPTLPIEVEEVLWTFLQRADPGDAAAPEAEISGHDQLLRYVNRWCRYASGVDEVRELAAAFAREVVYAGRDDRLDEILTTGGELDRMIASGWERYGGANPLGEEKTDRGIAEIFLAHYDEFRFDAVSRRWMARDEDGVWQASTATHVQAALFDLGAVLFDDAAREVRNAQRRSRLAEISHALRLSATIKRVASVLEGLTLIEPHAFDANPDLLFIRGGLVLDAEEATFKPLKALDEPFMPTRALGSDFRAPAAEAVKRWDDFVLRTFGSPEMATYVQRAVGATLLGRDKPHAIFFIYGQGGTGKSTFLLAIARVLGEYAEKFAFDLFTGEKEVNANNASPEIAKLKGVRMAYCSEIGSRARLGARMKDLTGGEKLNARHLYGMPFTFAPTHTVWVAGNEAPRADFLDSGIERRLQVMPADAKVDQPDALLLRTLTLEDGLRAIGAWAVEGLRAVLAARAERGDSLQPPREVVEARVEYWSALNPVEEWLREMEIRGPGEERLVEVHKAFLGWAEENHGLRAGSPNVPDVQRFSAALRRMGAGVRRGTGGVRYVQGVRLRAGSTTRNKNGKLPEIQ